MSLTKRNKKRYHWPKKREVAPAKTDKPKKVHRYNSAGVRIEGERMPRLKRYPGDKED